jgi:uncharacterized protein
MACDPFCGNPQSRSQAHEILETVLRESDLVGIKVTDVVFAALAIEHDATLASTDRDFRRFPGLKWVNPLASTS